MRRRLHHALALVGALAGLLAAAGPRAGETVVARVGDGEVLLSEVDARLRARIDSLLAQIEAAARGALDQAIDARLLASAGAAKATAVIDADVDRFLAGHPEYLRGPGNPPGSPDDVGVARAAVRHFLESKARDEAETIQLGRLRAGARVERDLPPPASLVEPLAAEQIVARVDGAPLRGGEVERIGALRLYGAREELHRVRARSLEELIGDRLLAESARRTGTDAAALVQAAAGPPIDAAAIEAYRQAEVEAGRPAPHASLARPQLELRRRREARDRAVAAARKEVPVEVQLGAPVPPELPVDVGGAPSIGGGGDAPRLVVYANYRCAPCRRAHEEIDRLLARPSPPQVVLRDFVQPYDPAARAASTWLRCAAEQQRHGALRKLLLAGQPSQLAGGWLGGLGAREIAARIGARPEPFLRCASDPRTANAIDHDTDEAKSLGFRGPPAFVVEGRGFSGVQSAEALRGALRAN